MTRHWRQIATLATLLVVFSFSAGAQSVPAASPATNPYNERLAAAEHEFATADALHAAVLLPRIEALREYVDDPRTVSQFLNQAAADGVRNPLLRDLAGHYLAQEAVHNGHLGDADLALHKLGTIRDWRLLGPFGPDDAEVTRFDSNASFKDAAGHELRWHPAPSFGPRESLDLGALYSASAVVYAATSVYSDTARAVALRYGSDGIVGIEVNGQALPATGEIHPYAFDQHAVAAQLRSGWNTILLKLTRTPGTQWRFTLRFTAPEGGGIELPVSTTAAKPGVVELAAKQEESAVADLTSEAEAAVAANPNSADALEAAGELERLYSRGSGLEHLQAAARLGPTADRDLEVAAACPDATCTFHALSEALRLDESNGHAAALLANYYAARGQSQKARDLLRKAAEAAPNDFVVRMQLANLSASTGWHSAAMADVQWLARQFPTPLWLGRELASNDADAGELERALKLAKAALAQDFDDVRARKLLAKIYQQQHNAAGLRDLYEQWAELEPTNPALRVRLAELEAGAGHNDAAIAVLRAALDLAPNDAQIHRQLGEVLATVGAGEEARTQMAAALQLDPTMDAVRQQLQPAGFDASNGSEAKYLVNAPELAAEAQHAEAKSSAPVVTLADVRLERVFPNGLSSIRIQQVFYIADEQGARDFAIRSIQYEPASQQLHMIAARAYKRDGRVIEADDTGDSSVADTSVSMYYDSRSHHVRFPSLAAGDVVELDYRLTPQTNINPYGDYFGDLVVFRTSRPIRMRRFVLTTPADRKFNVVSERMPAPPQVRSSPGERTYVWEAHDLEPLPNEPRGPSVTEISPYVNVSTFASWQDLGKWYAQLIAPQFALDDALHQQLTDILQAAHSDIDKINAIHEFVLRNTHYVALEFGIYSYKPYPVSQTYARRFGDCKDTASLMIALLRAAGIPADLALVRTRRLGDIDTDATSISVFDHAIVYLPDQNMWLDGTAEYAGSRELPLDDQGAMALTVGTDGNAQLRRIPVTLPMENYTHRRVQAAVEANGTIRFSGSAYTRGEDAPGLRREFEMPEQRRESVRNNLAEVIPGVRVDAVQVEGANDLEHDITVNFRGEVNTFAGHKVLTLSSSWMPRLYVQNLASQTTRKEELVLPAPWTTEEELHFALPENATVESLPKTRTIATPFGSALLKYEQRGTEIVITTSVQFRQWKISAADYAAFRDFCSQVEAAFRDHVKVELKG